MLAGPSTKLRAKGANALWIVAIWALGALLSSCESNSNQFGPSPLQTYTVGSGGQAAGLLGSNSANAGVAAPSQGGMPPTSNGFTSASGTASPSSTQAATTSMGGAVAMPSQTVVAAGGSLPQPQGGSSQSGGGSVAGAQGGMPSQGDGPSGGASAGTGGEGALEQPQLGDAAVADPTRDTFGIERLYPTLQGGAEWTSEHWANQVAYSIEDRRDPNDPQGLSGKRGTGTLDVTGTGELVFGGYQPRIYIYPPAAPLWTNVEFTAYYQRVSDDNTPWGGLVLGARTGEEGHATMPCDAHTYYARLRHDGALDFEKELMHTPSSTQGAVDATLVWPPDGVLPTSVWIGFKYVIYNLDDGSVKLEAYRDLSQGQDGGDWQLVGETVDAGGWFTQTDCAEQSPVNGQSDLIYTGSGACFIRDTGVIEARYKWVSVREIEIPESN